MRLGAEKNAIVTLAGEAAQRTFSANVRPPAPRGDWDQASHQMSYFVGSDRELEAYLKWLRIRAEEFVENPVNWNMIEAVAAVLLPRKCLTAGECQKESTLKNSVAERQAF